MPIAASVQGLGVHLRTAKATKSAALSQLADKETNMRTTKSRHELGKLNRVLFLWALEVEVWLVQMMCGKWIGGMIFLLVGMFTNVLGLGSLNSVCNRYQLLIWVVVYTANEDLESITDTQTELQLMELDAHNFVKFKVQNSHYPNRPLQKESKFFF
ncbi:hypothetical protein ACFX13_039305 [Malus domestica]